MRPTAPDAAARVAAARGDRWAGPQYEVMYLLSDTDGERIAALRNELAGLGDSVAVVGDGAALAKPTTVSPSRATSARSASGGGRR
ncbi:hypothetical protein [Nocardia terpenica]|uniref:hypothetical protein n=1 Tax=Nocardia terpenica TaxID=455432 RepID=UPI002F90A37C